MAVPVIWHDFSVNLLISVFYSTCTGYNENLEERYVDLPKLTEQTIYFVQKAS